MSADEALFQVACKRFAKEIGDRGILPVSDVDTGRSLSVFSIVVKTTKKKWFWRRKNVYKAKNTKLHALLNTSFDKEPELKEDMQYVKCLNPESIDEKEGQGTLAVKSVKSTFAVKTSKKLNFTTGETKSKYVNKRDLLMALQNRSIKLNDPQIKQIREAYKDCTLCVVTKVIVTKEEVDMTQQTDLDIETENTVSLDTVDGYQGIMASVRGKLSRRSCPGLKIYPGTALAYELCELKVNAETGELDLMIEPGLPGGFIGSSPIDSVEGIQEADDSLENCLLTLEETLKGLSEDGMGILREAVISLIKSPQDIDVLHTILCTDTQEDERREKYQTETQENGHSVSDRTLPLQETDLQTKVPETSDEMNPWIQILSLTTKPKDYLGLLKLIGWKKGTNSAQMPSQENMLMEVFVCVLESLKHLHEEHPETVHQITNISSVELHDCFISLYLQSLGQERDSLMQCSTLRESKADKETVQHILGKLDEDENTRLSMCCVLLATKPVLSTV